jgi:hypothetical protein
MDLATTPTGLTCAACGAAIESGYLPAVEYADGYEPLPDEAVCDACGYNEVGMMGCAPELDEVTDADADTLLHVRVTADGVEVLRAKE